MSSFIKEARNPKTGKIVKAYFIDDYFGEHQYGVGFRRDGKDAGFETTFGDEPCDFYPADKLPDGNYTGKSYYSQPFIQPKELI